MEVLLSRSSGRGYNYLDIRCSELLNALKQHAGYNTAVGQMVRERAATETRRVAKMQPGGGTVKDRVMHVSSALEKYLDIVASARRSGQQDF